MKRLLTFLKHPMCEWNFISANVRSSEIKLQNRIMSSYTACELLAIFYFQANFPCVRVCSDASVSIQDRNSSHFLLTQLFCGLHLMWSQLQIDIEIFNVCKNTLPWKNVCIPIRIFDFHFRRYWISMFGLKHRL